jgi:serine/threonine-protein kinase
MNDQMEELGKRHRRAFRSMFALIGAFMLMACLTAFLSVIRARTSPIQTPGPAVAAPGATFALEPRTGRGVPVESKPAAQPIEPSAVVDAQPEPSAVTTVRPLAPARVAKAQLAASLPTPAASASSVASATAKPEAAPSFGLLTIDTSPWSQVSMGGRVLGQTPLIGVKLPAGSHVLSLKNPELGIETSYPVTIENGKTTVRRIGIE